MIFLSSVCMWLGGLLRLYTIPQWLLFRIFVQKVFETNLNFRYKGVKNQKKINARYKLLYLKCFYFSSFLRVDT